MVTSPLSPILDELLRIVSTADVADIPAVLGDLERVRATAWARLSTPHVATQAPARPRPAKDRLLKPKEAAELLGVNARWVYDHADELPGSTQLSPRCRRFSEAALRRYMAASST